MKKLSFLFTFCLTIAFSMSSTAQNCQALFQHFPTSGNSVQFVDSSFSQTVGNYTRLWDFGDGNSSTSGIPVHTYAQAGVYVACLTITTNTQCVSTFCDTIRLGGIVTPPCNANYSYYSNAGNVTTFVNLSSPLTGQTYSWDFGDGSPVSNAVNPTHTYPNANSYGVTLTATSGNGSTCTYYDTVYVNTCYSYFISNVGANGNVNFTGYGGASSSATYAWDFGDGSANSNQKHANHTYTSSGTFNITYTITDSAANATCSYTDSVVINLGTPQNCNASYYVALDSSASFKVVLYNTSSNASSHTYFWDFGDGTTGSGRIPQHQYQNFGSYVVCLTITDMQLNCTSTFCDTVGMDSLGNLKAAGFGLEVRNPISVGVSETTSLDELSIYPNPATNQVSVDLRSVSERVEIKILDISGKEVVSRKRTNSGSIETLDISNLNSGFYFMILNDGAKQRIEKIIVNK